MISQQTAFEDCLKPPPLETIAQTQRRIADEFALLDDWSDRYQSLVDFGRRLAPMPACLKVNHNRIFNCHGEVWLAAERRAGLMYLSAESETDVVAGMLAIVVEVYSGHTLSDVLEQPLTVLDTIGLTDRLSLHRRAGFREILSHLHELAAAHG